VPSQGLELMAWHFLINLEELNSLSMNLFSWINDYINQVKKAKGLVGREEFRYSKESRSV
jgi:hypothetical protein